MKRRTNKLLIRKFLIIAGLAVVLTYVIVVAVLYFEQDKMIFYPRPVNGASVEQLKQQYPVQDLTFTTTDGNTLKGWLVNADAAAKKPLVIYFGGNAEEVSDMISLAATMPQLTWALVNYRGYGDSTGRPSEAAIFRDSLLLYDQLSARPEVDATKIRLFGTSLGSGAAVFVAQNRAVERILLATPYDSVESVAQGQLPLVPVSLLLMHKFDSAGRAADIHMPVLILAAGRDEVIPAKHAKRLAEVLNGNSTYRLFPAADHNSIWQEPEFLEAVRGFLDK